MKKLLLIPHLKVHNANALSSPFTVGFPAMTAWLGAMHALERKLKSDGFTSLVFKGVGIVAHSADLQTYQGPGDYVHSIVGTANPLDKDGSRAAFIEEARIHLDVSIVAEYDGVSKDDEDRLIERVTHHLRGGMKMAGGDIFGFKNPELTRISEDNERAWSEIRRKLMPGYAIVERRELMKEAMENGADAIDALLDFLAVHYSCEIDGDVVSWKSARRTPGWIVPIAVGFQGISELGTAKNQRDPDTLHRFAESVVTLGEFKMAYKIASVDDLLWRYNADSENSLYLCQQTVPATAH
ncbi:MAG: type I-F CRISPR-associated protein Csy2 [Sulfuricurvum sp.]